MCCDPTFTKAEHVLYYAAMFVAGGRVIYLAKLRSWILKKPSGRHSKNRSSACMKTWQENPYEQT